MQTYNLSNGRLSARLVPFGATLVDLRLSDWDRPLVLGFERLEDYSRTSHYAGAVIGRHANRIQDGRVEIGNEVLELPRNGEGHHLHGGETGLARQTWAVDAASNTRLQLSLVSPDGHEGYPGRCEFLVTYEIVPPATLRVTFVATTDRTTLINLCHHPYFNFTGKANIGDHLLEVAAQSYLVSDADLVPTGEIANVRETAFDFLKLRRLDSISLDPGINHNFCLATQTRKYPEFAAALTAPGAPKMQIWTTQPGLHVYDGYKLAVGLIGLAGRRYGPRSGVCLEAQNWPNSPRHRHFPSAILQPSDIYRQVTEYRFG